MNKTIGFGLGAAVVIGGAAVGYFGFVSYIEAEARAMLTQPALDTPGTVIEIGDIVAEPFANRITVRDYRFSSPMSASGMSLPGMDPGAAPSRSAVEGSVGEAVVDFETSYFLTPITRVVSATVSDAMFQVDDEFQVEGSDDVTRRRSSFSMASVTIADLGPLDAAAEPLGGQASLEQTIAVDFDLLDMASLKVEEFEFVTPDVHAPLLIDSLEILDVSNGVIGESRIEGMTTKVAVAADLTELGSQLSGDAPPIDSANSPIMDVTFEMLGFERLNAQRFIDFGQKMSQEPKPEPDLGEVLELIEGTAFYIKGMTAKNPDGTVTSLGAFRIGDLTLEDGMPTRFGISMTESRQETSPEAIEQSLALLPIPLGIEPPAVVDSELALDFVTDVASDSSMLSYMSYDTFTDVTVTFELAATGLTAAKRAAELIPGTNPFEDTKFVGLDLTLESSTRWDPPGLVGNRPSPRLFAMSVLQDGAPPTPRTRALLPPIMTFLAEGGTLSLSIAPEEAMGQREFAMMDLLAIDQRLELLGVSVTHLPAN